MDPVSASLFAPVFIPLFAYLFGGIDFAHLLGSIDTKAVLVFFDSDEGGAWLILLLLLAGPAFFTYNYLRYRNSNQRHYHEKETPVTMNNLRQYDNFIEHKVRQRHKLIDGANNEAVYGSLVKQGRVEEMLTGDSFGSVAKKIGTGVIKTRFR